MGSTDADAATKKENKYMSNTYKITYECGTAHIEDMANDAAAIALARETAATGYDPQSETQYFDASVEILRVGDDREPEWEHVETVSVALDPDAPEGCDHAWGTETLQGHGGGVVITRTCALCGCEHRHDTWGQRRDTGAQGVAVDSYRMP